MRRSAFSFVPHSGVVDALLLMAHPHRYLDFVYPQPSLSIPSLPCRTRRIDMGLFRSRGSRLRGACHTTHRRRHSVRYGPAPSSIGFRDTRLPSMPGLPSAEGVLCAGFYSLPGVSLAGRKRVLHSVPDCQAHAFDQITRQSSESAGPLVFECLFPCLRFGLSRRFAHFSVRLPE
jgi:hypothetical protein